jgi:hypothetical protein
MKTKLLLVATCLLSLNSFSQLSKIDGVNTFLLRNSGAILDTNKDVDGYYFYYVIDKLKKGDNEFAIQILDKNLNEVAKKTYIDNKNTFLMKSSFNNQALMFAMANYKERKIDLLQFDKQANQNKTVSIPLTQKEVEYFGHINNRNGGGYNFLFPIEDKGFIFSKVQDNKKIGYSLKYIPTDGGKAWEYNSPADSKEILLINPIELNNKFIVAVESAIPSAISRKVTLRTKILDSGTGKLIFELENNKNNKPRLITNAFVGDDNKIILMGEYFKDGDNIFDDKSLGLFAQVMDMNGKIVKESYTTWVGDVDKIAKTSKGFIEDKGYVFFHNIVKSNTGDFYAIGEYYKKAISAGGTALKIVSGGNASATKISISDAVIFKFNSEFKLISINDFKKTVSSVPSISDFASPQLNAHVLKSFGYFDYEYTQIDNLNNRFYTCFIDYEKIKGSKNKRAFKAIIYDEGEFSEDKIYLTENEKEFKLMPAKVGNVLLLEYDKKAKSISIHLEKINIK